LFFFQAEDGIRDFHVTGVQTCALPISVYLGTADGDPRLVLVDDGGIAVPDCTMLPAGLHWRDLLTAQDRTGAPILVGAGEVRCRSEERRVGEEGGWQASTCQ